MFDTENSTATVAEGQNATVCISVSSSDAMLNFDLTVNLTSVDGKATSKYYTTKITNCAAFLNFKLLTR